MTSRISNVCAPCIGGVEYSGYESDTWGTKNKHTRVKYCTIHFGFEVCGSTCACLNHLGKLHFLIHIKIFSFIKIALYESSKTHALPEERFNR